MPGTGSRSLDLITVRLRSKRDTLLPFAFFISLAIMVHFLPNLGVPLHSDTAWIFRLQSSDDAGIESDAPYWMREMGAYQSGPVEYGSRQTVDQPGLNMAYDKTSPIGKE